MEKPALNALILTLFPEMFPGPLGHSLPGKALEKGLWSLETLQIRGFALDKHHTVDDTPYGGGAGMVMKPDVVGRAIEAARTKLPDAKLVYFTPRGKPLTQGMAKELAAGGERRVASDFILLCGRFEGIDERIVDYYQPLEISLGDFVLFGGEVAAMAFLEALLRQVPGALGNPETHGEESFDYGEESALLLEYPHYTKPPSWQGLTVPEALISGHHSRISGWRKEQAEKVTRERRPDLWELYCNKK